MKFKSEDDAKNYSIGMTAKPLHPNDVDNRILSYRSYFESAISEDDKEYWLSELESLEEYVNSDVFRNGEYSQGIDLLILELIEWRSAIYAFQNVDTKEDPFSKHSFYAQWLLGGNYAVFCILGKLVSKDKRDNSLRRLWPRVSDYIKDSELCTAEEVELIFQKMHKKDGQFSNNNSPAMLFRNKVIAHNESSPKIEWGDVDEDIKLLCRIWSLITMWSSFGIMQPFRKDEQAFSGLEAVFSSSEIDSLKLARKKYIEKVEYWCTHSLVDGVRLSERGPFGEISFSFEINTREK